MQIVVVWVREGLKRKSFCGGTKQKIEAESPTGLQGHGYGEGQDWHAQKKLF
ncbi:MAG: hypothetical protein ACK5IJ_12175 [Mangrovibacterium sp.]